MARFVSVLTLLLSITVTAPAQWGQTAGPLGGSVPVIFVDGTDVYAGTYEAGIFKSTDSGATWHQKINGFGYQTVVAMAKCGRYLIASGTEGLYRSSDGGDSWTLIPGFDALGGVNTLAVQGTRVIAGTSYGGVYASSDTGASWESSNAGLPVTVDDLLVPASTTAGADFFIFGGSVDSMGVFRSTDLGATWARASAGLPEFDIINALFYDGSTLFAAGTDVYKSTNLGASWTPAGSGIPAYSNIQCFTSRGLTIFAGGWNGVFASNNGGGIWVPVAGGLPVMEVRSLATHGTNLFAGTIADGLYGSTNAGTSWEKANVGIRARDISGFIVDQDTIYCNGKSISLTVGDWGGWYDVRGDLPDSASMPTLVYVRGDTLFAHEGFGFNSLSRSLDGGLTWTRVWPELYNFGTVRNIVRTESGYWTAVGSIYRSTDIGSSWSSIDSAGTSGGYLAGIERFNGVLFAFGQMIFRSTDNGSTWVDVTPTDPSFSSADGMAAVGSTLFASDRFAGTLYRSTNGGSSWGVVASPAGGNTIDQLYGSGGRLFVCSNFLGIYQSTNNGVSWMDMTPGLPPDQPTYVVALLESGDLLFAGTGGNSVWWRALPAVTSIGENPAGLPAKTALIQNYPNPFNPSMTIRWNAASADRIVLKVYDMLGREITTLFDGVSEPGEHSVNWEAGGFPGGVYYCRMITGSSVETRAMVLMR